MGYNSAGLAFKTIDNLHLFILIHTPNPNKGVTILTQTKTLI